MNNDPKLNILMCCHLPLKYTLGGAKVYIEAAQTYRQLGHQVKLVGIDEIVGTDQPFMDENWRVKFFPEKLSDYIKDNGQSFDVIEFESLYLPFPKSDNLKSILVARSVLLDLHLKEIKIPRFKGLRSFAGFLFKSRHRKSNLAKKIEQSLTSMKYADRVNVPNPSDKKILTKYGIDSNKIIVQPYGIFREKFNQFVAITNIEKNNYHKKNVIAFVGTFDNRKGAVEFPEIIKKILRAAPETEFKLLGVLGMFPNKESIHKHIGEEFKERVHIIERYSPDDLPGILKECSLGIFPSYLEGFGFGVLEMMAMGLPVVGYNSPGINMLILEELIVEPGDVNSLITIFLKLFKDNDFRVDCQKKCRTRVESFVYENQENNSIKSYQNNLKSWLK